MALALEYVTSSSTDRYANKLKLEGRFIRRNLNGTHASGRAVDVWFRVRAAPVGPIAAARR